MAGTGKLLRKPSLVTARELNFRWLTSRPALGGSRNTLKSFHIIETPRNWENSLVLYCIVLSSKMFLFMSKVANRIQFPSMITRNQWKRFVVAYMISIYRSDFSSTIPNKSFCTLCNQLAQFSLTFIYTSVSLLYKWHIMRPIRFLQAIFCCIIIFNNI